MENEKIDQVNTYRTRNLEHNVVSLSRFFAFALMVHTTLFIKPLKNIKCKKISTLLYLLQAKLCGLGC